MDKYTVKLIEGFLTAQYERFQVYLESLDIESTEAETIISALARKLDQSSKFDPTNQPVKSQPVYSCIDSEFTESWENILHELSENHPDGTIVPVLKGVSVPVTHKQLIRAAALIIDMQERAFAAFDDTTCMYLSDIDKPHIDKLQRLLTDWFDKNIKQPTFYNVKNIEEIEVTVGENEAGQN